MFLLVLNNLKKSVKSFAFHKPGRRFELWQKMDRIHRSWKSDVRCIGMRYFVYKTGETAADDFGQSTAVSCVGEAATARQTRT